MGEVYKAVDTRLGRSVAIKILAHPFAADATSRQRFEREAKAISSLNHPHICTLYDVGSHDGLEFLVMEHLEGETLSERLGQRALPLAETLRCAIEMADALEAAHERGIIHRDFKPANVMLTSDGAVKLLDFGIAKAATGLAGASSSEALTIVTKGAGPVPLIGTPNYMSPGPRHARRPTHRYLGFRLRAVRNVDGEKSIRRKDSSRHHVGDPRARAKSLGAAAHYSDRRAPLATPLPREGREAPTA
jgi:serine/threonine protein kinase